jgi:hypothetical protein
MGIDDPREGTEKVPSIVIWRRRRVLNIEQEICLSFIVSLSLSLSLFFFFFGSTGV